MDEETAEKLQLAGITTVEALASTTVARLEAIGIPKSKATQLTNSAYVKSSFYIRSGDELVKQFENREYLTSGAKELDRMLGGSGFETQKTYEIYGPEGIGKSTILHQLVCTAYLPPNKGGLGTSTIYIDTESSFSISKVQQIAIRFGITPSRIARAVVRIAPPTSDVLVYFCENLLFPLAQEKHARVFLLDSIATQFRAEYGTDPTALPERQSKAGRVVEALLHVAQQTNGVAILTNHETIDPTGYGKPGRHALGLLIGHASQVRIKMQIIPNQPTARNFIIEKAVDLSPSGCLLEIANTGFVDPTPPSNIDKKTDGESVGMVKAGRFRY